jgi:rhamnosyltransferase
MENACCEGYSSDLLAFDEEKKTSWYLKKSGEQRELDYLFQGASAGCTYVLSKKAALLVKAKLVNNQKHCHTDLSHDWLIYAICRSHGLTWLTDENTRILYRQHGSNAYGALPGFLGLIQKAKSAQSGWYRRHALELRRFLDESSLEESSVFSAIERYKLKDRVWLFVNAHRFRRTRRDVFLLRFSFLFGLF